MKRKCNYFGLLHFPIKRRDGVDHACHFNYYFIDTVSIFNAQIIAIRCEINTSRQNVYFRGIKMAETRRTQMTRHLFRTALVELMQDKPLHKITIKEICDKADLNRATFYLHYRDQDELFDEIIALFEKDITENIFKLTGEGDKVVLMSKYFDYIRNNSGLYTILMTDSGAKTRIVTDVLSELKAEMPVYGNELENRYVYTYLIDGTCSIIQRWIDNGFDLSTKDLARLIDNIYCTTHRKM